MKIYMTILLVCFVTYTTFSEHPVWAAENDLYSSIQTYDYGKSRQSLAAIEAEIRTASPASYGRIEAKLLQTLRSPQITFAGKQFVCRMLRRVGSAQSVPALSQMLVDEKLSHMARFALLHMPAPEAGDALRKGLARTSGDLKIGIVGSLGQRGDRNAVPDIAKLVIHRDINLARTAIQALGRIGGGEAARALTNAQINPKLESLRDDALLLCANQMLTEGRTNDALGIYRKMVAPDNRTVIRIAGYRGLVLAEKEKAVPIILALLKEKDNELQRSAGKLIAEMSSRGTTKAFAEQLQSLDSSAQIVLINALENREDKTAAPYIAKAVSSSDIKVRLGATRALGTLGSADDAELLAKTSISDGESGQAAMESLCRLSGAGVANALIGIMKTNTNASVRVNVIQAVIIRRETATVPALLQAARDRNSEVRHASYKALGVLADRSVLPAMVSMLISAQDSSDRNNLERALVNMVTRNKDTDPAPIIRGLTYANDTAKGSLLVLLPRIGGRNALQAVRTQLKSSNATIKKSAIRALADWPEPAPLTDLLEVAQSDNDPVHRILAIRGYIKLLSIPANRSSEETVKMLNVAMGIAKRPDEKRAILSALPKYASQKALEMAIRAQSDRDVVQEANLATKKIKEIMINMRLKVTASRNTHNAKNAIDGNRSTRWDTGRGMTPGDWFMVDLGVENIVKSITLDAAGSSGDYPRGYEVYVSFDGGSWGKSVVTGKSKKALTVIRFPKPVRTRYIKIIQTGSVPNLFWSIHDLKVEFE
jgi:HEAT repeat protein